MVESEVAGFFVFSHIRMIGYLRDNDCPTGLEPPAVAKKGKKLQ